MASKQIVQVDGRFTYQWDGARVIKVGDIVKVDGRNAGSHFTGTVAALGSDFTGKMKNVVEIITPEPRRQMYGSGRKAFAESIKYSYEVDGWSIRKIADHVGRSYGFIHTLLVEAGTTIRPRGGSQR